MITKEQLAERLNGRPMGDEIYRDEEKQAKDAGLVVVFGHSDDCVEFRGAIRDEDYAHDDEVWIDHSGVKRMPEEDQEVLEKYNLLGAFMAKAVKIAAVFGPENWVMSTSLPHATFDILEDGEKFCRGIVFSIGDLPK